MKTILVALEGGPSSERAFATALRFARALRTRLVLLNVAEPAPVELHAVGSARKMIVGMIEALRLRAHRHLQTLARRSRRFGIRTKVEQVIGIPAPMILARMRAHRAKYLVLGSHGHGMAYDIILGSTARAVLREMKAPVIVVPSK